MVKFSESNMLIYIILYCFFTWFYSVVGKRYSIIDTVIVKIKIWLNMKWFVKQFK